LMPGDLRSEVEWYCRMVSTEHAIGALILALLWNLNVLPKVHTHTHVQSILPSRVLRVRNVLTLLSRVDIAERSPCCLRTPPATSSTTSLWCSPTGRTSRRISAPLSTTASAPSAGTWPFF
jgi:hypothetical protein